MIHRDLKPHNVIVDDADQAKVTDFGIARAGASDMTETGSIMGTAQYLSPEQAQGHAVNEASDLYSIGVVLYEMLTGRVPFDAESAITIALKHVSETPVAPSVINPEIPPELDQTVMWVLNKNSADRPTDADQLITVLEHCREAIVSGAAGKHTASMAAVAAVAAYSAPSAGGFIAGTATGPATGSERRDGTGQFHRTGDEAPERRSGWTPVLWTLLVLMLVAGAATAAYFLSRPRQVTVPDVRNDSIALATRVLTGDHFVVSTVRQTSRRPAGIVIGESPSPGTKADRGSNVTLTVSRGRGNVPVPFVQGRTPAAAERALRRAGLVVGGEVPRASTAFPVGQVIGTSPPAAQSVAPGTTVTVFVSSGPPKVQVPSVTGDTETAAATALAKAGFNPQVAQKQTTSAPVGTVISQSPQGGQTAPKGSNVTITVASAPATATVPSVKGDPVAGAISALAAAGFKVVQGLENVTNPANNGIVIRQSPGPNATAKKGSTVTIIVGHYVQSSSSSTTTTTTSSATTTTTTSSPGG